MRQKVRARKAHKERPILPVWNHGPARFQYRCAMAHDNPERVTSGQADSIHAMVRQASQSSRLRHSASFCSKLRAACAGLDDGSTTVS